MEICNLVLKSVYMQLCACIWFHCHGVAMIKITGIGQDDEHVLYFLPLLVCRAGGVINRSKITWHRWTRGGRSFGAKCGAGACRSTSACGTTRWAGGSTGVSTPCVSTCPATSTSSRCHWGRVGEGVNGSKSRKKVRGIVCAFEYFVQ